MANQQLVLVDDPRELGGALARVTDDVVGVDVERADAENYHRRAALVQVGDADAVVLVDPIAIPEPTALADLCAERLVVLHAIQNDLAPLDALGVELPNVADTAVAAAVLGLPTGLGGLLDEVLGVTLDTDKARYQRADWSARPLSSGMLAYAAGDVVDLPALWRALETMLTDEGRTDWYEQELVATIDVARSDNRDWERTKGSGRLDPRERAVLRSLWEAREEICRTHDIAPNRLVHDRTLLALAQEPATDPAALVARDPQRRRGPVTDHASTLFAAQQDGVDGPPLPIPPRRRWTDHQRSAYDTMRRRRTAIAEDLGIDAGLLCASRQLHAAVTAEPVTPDELAEAAGLRPWQRDLVGDSLWAVWEDAVAHADVPGVPD